MAFQAGTAFVPVMPSFRGFQQQIARAAGTAGREAGRQVTRSMGDEAERGSSSVGDRLRGGLSRLNTVMTGVGIAAGAALTASLVKGLDATRAQAKLANQLGASAKDSERFGRIAGQLYSRAYGESMDDVRGAIGAVVTSIDGMRGANEGAVKQMTKSALTLASTFDLDVARAVQVVGQAVRTGLVKDAQQGFDLLMVSLQRVPTAVREDLLDALDEYGPFMDQLGIRGERAFEILVQAAGKGMYGIDKAGDAFKEITLRIASDSDAVDAALQRLGTTQEDVQGAFAKGGSAAKIAFERIVAGLLSVKDPGERAKLAIELFGTPIEDLNTKDIPAFLKSLSGAEVSLGKVAGATDRAGKAMEETAGAKVESFKRSLEQNLAKVVAEDVIPKLEQLGRVAGAVGVTPSGVVQAGLALAGLAAAFKAAGLAATVATAQVGRFSIVRGVTGTASAVAGAVTGFRNVNAAMAANATMSTRLGAALRSQILLWRQQAAATGVSTARVIANAAAQKVAAAATRVWALATAIFNAVVAANPIALIIIAIVALVAAVVLAYKRFDWFRNLVNTVWAGIQQAISAAWAFIKPVFLQIASVLTTVVGTALRWYWAYVKFVFTTVLTVIQTAWNFIKPIFLAIANVVRTVLGAAFIFYQNIAKIVWIAIQIYIKIAWTLIKGYFNAIKWYVTQVLAPIFRWFWNSVIKPVWNFIVGHIRKQWGQIKAGFNEIRNFLAKILGPAFRAFRVVASQAWTGTKNAISAVINGGIKPAFNGLKTAVRAVRDAFSNAVNGIKKIWDRLKGIAKTPVNFVIGLYNDGLVRLVNGIAKLAGIGTRLSPIPKFATGGVLPGYSPGVDSLIAAVSPGESIFRPEFTRAVGADWVQTANAVARRSGPRGVRDWMAGGGLGFSRGGVVPGFAGGFDLGGIVGGFLGKAKDFALGNAAKAAKGILERVLGSVVPGKGMFRDIVAAIPKWIKNNILGFIGNLIEKIGGDGRKVVSVAEKYVGLSGNPNKFTRRMGMNGLPWCAMFVDGVFDEANASKALRGVGGRAAVWSYRALPKVSPANKRPGDLALYRGDTGHINIYTGKGSTTIGGNESNSVRRQSGYIGSASSIRRPKFARGGIVERILGQDRDENRRGTTPVALQALRAVTGQQIYDDGGLLHKGLTLAYHGSRQPDRVLSDAQWSAIYGAARGGDGPTSSYTINARTADFTVRDLETLQRKQDARARVGRPR